MADKEIKLTSKQKNLLPEYREKWQAIALDTSPCDRQEAEKWIWKAYQDVEDVLKEPPAFYWAKSPLHCLYIHHALTLTGKDGKERDAILDSMSERVSGKPKSSPLVDKQTLNETLHGVVHEWLPEFCKEEYGDQVYGEIRSALHNPTGGSTAHMAMSQMGTWAKGLFESYLSGKADDKPEYEVGKETLDEVTSNFQYGSTDGMLLGVFDYLLNVVPIEGSDLRVVEAFLELSKYCGWYLAYTNVCIVSEKPLEINIENGNLHKDGGAAVTFGDGFSLWALNGIQVSREIAETPWNELDPHLVQTEENAEVKREIVNKIGIERVCQKLGAKTMDKGGRDGEYELIMLKLKGGGDRPYLKIRNASAPGTYHIEGVPPHIETVEAALAWRASEDSPLGEPLFRG